MDSSSVIFHALPHGPHLPVLGVQKYELSFAPLLESRVFMIQWKLVYLYSDCRRGNSFVAEFLWNPLFIFSIVTLNQSFCRVYRCGNCWKLNALLRITTTFKANTSFYFYFIALCIVLLIKEFSHVSLLASSFVYTLYYLFASPYNLAVSSFDKPRFEVKRFKSLICTLFSKMFYRSNDAYL